MEQTILTNGRAITPVGVLEPGSVVIEDGLIVEVNSKIYPAQSQTIDVKGQFILPGVINLHDDSYEKMLQPRKGVFLPAALAFHQMEWALAAAGVTTTYHAVSFDRGLFLRDRTVARAAEMAKQLLSFRQEDFSYLNHHLLYRCDLRSEGALDAIIGVLQSPLAGEPPHYLSLNDHSPGQGQYGKQHILQAMIKALLGPAGDKPEIVAAREKELWDLKAQTEPIRRHQLEQVAALVKQSDSIIVAGHDDDSAETVDNLYELGIRVSEFPINFEAATRARELNLPIIAGAPNIVRGGSHTGNVNALELVQRGLCDVLVADYAPSTLLHAVFMLIEQKVLGIVDAVNLVTANAARVVGLSNKIGSLQPGLSADVIVVNTRTNPQLTTVQMMLVGGQPYHQQASL